MLALDGIAVLVHLGLAERVDERGRLQDDLVDRLLEPEFLGDLVVDVTLLVVLDENVCGDAPPLAFVVLGKGVSAGGHLSRETIEQMTDKDRLAGSSGPLDEDEPAKHSVCEGVLSRQST